MISVVLCTYNGSKYIEKQLESIMNQTVMPDEVIIQDDCSDDDTVFLCEKFIKNNQLSWNVTVNENRKGYRLNFVTALRKTNGDIVFLCDQDDIWYSNKVEVMTGLMDIDESIKSLASTVDRIDEKGTIIEKHLKHPYRKNNGLKKISAKEFYNFPQYMGMTMALKKELIDRLDEDYADAITHDMFCNYYAVRMDGLYFLDKALTKRRSTGENISFKESEKVLKEKYKGNKQLRKVSENLIILEHFKKIDKSKNIEDKDLDENIEILRVRKENLDSKSKKKTIANCGQIIRINGAKEFIKDILS